MKYFLITLLLLFSATANAADSVAYVDFERVYRDSKNIRANIDDVNTQFQSRAQELEKMGQEARVLQEQLQKEALTLGESEKKEINTKLTELTRNLNRKHQALTEDRGLQIQERQKAIDLELRSIIEAIAKEKKYTMVLNPFIAIPAGERLLTHSILLYADKNTDITEEIIKRFDQQVK